MASDKTLVLYKNTSYHLNDRLIKQQCLTDDEVQKIINLHVEKLMIFESMANIDDKKLLIQYAIDVENIEYEMQFAWGFNMDKTHHQWYDVPKCTCPKIDNQERKGSIYKKFSPTCIIHS